ncbi:GNAT family N-acetyltransferase [Kitasatospora sp. HPMI-4]|uniref:GNAT family N-acetyltransferase n=1 Tax=Kitasatospora sp. HPMI-4 TaxID=3448443 RepID=UPI003F1C7AFC
MRLLSLIEGEPRLADGDVLIRRPITEDAATLLAGTRDPLVREFMQAVIPHRDLAAAERWIEQVPPMLWTENRAAYFAVVDGGGSAVGWAELVDLRPEEGSAEVSVWLLPAARSLRVATSALRLICRFGFEWLDLRRIDAYAAAENMPSQVTGAYIGFRRAGYRPGLFRSSRTHELHDAVYATLVPEDLC